MREQTSGKYYCEKKEYIETVLNMALQPIQDFEAIKYARDSIMGREFIKVSDQVGGCVFLDVTAESLEGVLRDVCKVVLIRELKSGNVPPSIITDLEFKRKIAPLFK